MCILIGHVEHVVFAAIMGSVLNEVIGPDMVAVLGPKADEGAVIEPETPPLGLFTRDLEPFGPVRPYPLRGCALTALASPDTLDPLIVDQPVGPPQHGGDLAVAIAAILPGQFDDVGGQLLLIVTALGCFTLGRAVPPERPVGATLGHRQHRPDMVDAGRAKRRA